jgi:putative intracellular protease/amidase
MPNPFIALLLFVSASLCYAEGLSTAPRKVLFVLTSHEQLGSTGKSTGYFLGEAAHPYEVLTKAGYTVEFASPKGGMAPADSKSLKFDDEINKRLWNDPTFQKGVAHTIKASKIDPSQYEAILFVGGHGAMWDFPGNEDLAKAAGQIYDRGGVVAAVCHGPAGLLDIKLANGQYLLVGKDVAGFTNDEEKAVELEKVVPFLLADKMEERGAKHLGAANFQPKVVVSERLVTGQNPASATGVGEAMVKLLDAKPKASQ